MIQESRWLFDELPVERACQLLEVSRSEYYHSLGREAPGLPNTAGSLREAMEALVLQWPGYGHRRITAQLRRDGWNVGRKRVLRVMREEGWLPRPPRRWVKTTDSEHGLQVYPNLLAQRGWRDLTGINQAWVADLTYIRLPRGFCYLAAILDAYSRRVIGWSLAPTLAATVVLEALQQALQSRSPSAGWIHHSDRGVQYACRNYVERVRQAGGQVSMAAKGTPRENARAESFFRTLKHEEVYLQDYQSFGEAEASLGAFLNEVYNQKRLHSAVGYRPPSEFEELIAAGVLQ